MSIRRRITIASATAVAVTVVIVSVGAFIAARQQVLQPIDQSLEQRAAAIADVPPFIDREGGRNLIGSLGSILFRPRPGDFDSVYYQVIFPDGALVNVGEDELTLPLPGVSATSGLAPPRYASGPNTSPKTAATIGICCSHRSDTFKVVANSIHIVMIQ